MNRIWIWTKNGLAIAGMLALGFWFGTSRPVNASSRGSSYDAGGQGVQFQFTGPKDSSSLLVYQPETRTVYLYQGALVGNASLQCSYMFQMTRPGEVIHRIPCAIPQLNP